VSGKRSKRRVNALLVGGTLLIELDNAFKAIEELSAACRYIVALAPARKRLELHAVCNGAYKMFSRMFDEARQKLEDVLYELNSMALGACPCHDDLPNYVLENVAELRAVADRIASILERYATTVRGIARRLPFIIRLFNRKRLEVHVNKYIEMASVDAKVLREDARVVADMLLKIALAECVGRCAVKRALAELAAKKRSEMKEEG